MAREAIRWNRGPLPLFVAQVALGAVRERMHAGERESSAPVHLEWLDVVPAPR